jgi:CBS domain-containing protein
MNHLSLEQILPRISQSESFGDLRMLRDQVHEMFREHLLFSYSLEIHESVNEVHDALIQRTIKLSEMILEERGFGSPPVKYAFILFGSGGRREQTLWSDQDNGFIYEDSDVYSVEDLESYFLKLITIILDGLGITGYPPCQGNVVSSHAQWRKPYSEYVQMMKDWFEEPNWENARYLLIMADMRSIYGALSLVSELRNEFHEYVKQHPSILQPLLSNTLHHKASLGVFGQIITERYGEDAGGFDIKYGTYIPIVNGIRLLAIQAGIQRSSTLARLHALVSGNHIDEHMAGEWEQAFTIALRLRDLTPFQLENGLYTTRGKLTAEQLTKERRQDLKYCLRIGNEMQKFVRKTIGIQIEKG